MKMQSMSHLLKTRRPSGLGRIVTCMAPLAWLIFCGGFLLLLLCLPAARAAQPVIVAPPEAAPLPKSVFMDDPQFGKDPFFPASTRRGAQILKTSATVVIPDLTVKGISGTKERRLAIINNRTFEVGEEAELKVSGQLVKIRCVEIREKSVLLEVNGQAKALSLSSKP